jgi:hypothetical protein
MEYTITFTPESVCNLLNRRYKQNFTVEQIEEQWDEITDYIENWSYNGLMGESLWEDFNTVSEDWGITLFN